MFRIIILFFLIVGCQNNQLKSTNSNNYRISVDNNNIVIKGTISYNLDKKYYTTYTNAKIYNFKISNKNCIISENLTDKTFETNDSINIPYTIVVDNDCVGKDLVISANVLISYKRKGSTILEKQEDFIKEKIPIKNGISIKVTDLPNEIYNNPVDIYIRLEKNDELIDNKLVREVIVKSNNPNILLVKDKNKTSSIIIYSNSSYEKITLIPLQVGEANLTITAFVDNKIAKINKKIKVKSIFNSYSIQTNNINQININSFKILNIKILDKNGKLVPDNLINYIKLKSRNGFITFDKNTTIKTIYRNNANIKIYSHTIAGIENVEIIANINNKKIVSSKKIVIVGGKPYKISIVFIGVEPKEGLFEGTYKVVAVDRFGNKAKAGSAIKVGVIGGVREDLNGKKLYVKNDGVIEYYNNTTLFYSNNNYSFDKVLPKDTLIILGNENHNNPLYLGGWIVRDIIAKNTLSLYEKYDGNITSNLDFVIGESSRYNTCQMQSEIIEFDSKDGVYALNDNGEAYFKLRVSPYFIGKTIFLYANSYEDKRVGVGYKKMSLYSNLIKATNPFRKDKQPYCTTDSNDICIINFSTDINKNNFKIPNLHFSKNDFTVTNCKYVKFNNLVTNCEGNIIIELSADNNSSCSVRWNGTISGINY